jgi:hypothetical protein
MRRALHRSKESWNHYHPEDIWNAMSQHSHALHGINGDSAGNYHLMDKESTRGKEFHRELPAHLPRFRPVRSKCTENPSNGNNSRIISFKFHILTMPTFKKI